MPTYSTSVATADEGIVGAIDRLLAGFDRECVTGRPASLPELRLR